MFQNRSQTFPSSSVTTSNRPTEYEKRPNQILMQFNHEIFKRNVLTDVECVVEGQVFHAHRALLVCFSPYLKKRLVNTAGRPTSKRIYIPNIGFNEFEILLRYMYSGDLEIDCNNFFDVYKAASLLEMREAKIQCLQRIDGRNEIQTYFYAYVLSKKLGVQQNWQKALQLIAHRFEETVFSKEFMQLNVNYVVEILSSQSIGARSELIVFLAALNWLNHNFVSRGIHAVTVMGCVRFSSMSMEEIVACYHPPFLDHVIQITEVMMMLYRATCYIAAKSQGQETWFKHYASPKRNLTLECLPMEIWHKGLPHTTTEEADFYSIGLSKLSEYQTGAREGSASSAFPRRLENPVELIPGNAGRENKYLEQRKLYGTSVPERDDLRFRDRPFSDDFEEMESAYESNGSDRENIGNKIGSYKKDEKLRNILINKEYEIKKNTFPKMYKESETVPREIQYTIPEDIKIIHLIKGPQKFVEEKSSIDQVTQTPEKSTKFKESSYENKEQKPTKFKESSYENKDQKQYDESKPITSSPTKNSNELNQEASSQSLTQVTSDVQDVKENGCILIIGGMNPKNIKKEVGGAVLILNMKTNKWMHYTDIPEPRHNHCAQCFENSLYVVGGCDPQETVEKNHYVAKRSCFKLNLKNSKWSKLPDMKCARLDHAMVVYDGQLFVIGGQDENERLLKSVEVYEPKRNRWKHLNSSMCCGRKSVGIAVYDDRIWIAGGLIQSGRNGQLQVVSHVDCYNPREKKWYFNLYSLPGPRCFCSLAVWDEKLYCLGGMIRRDDGKTCPTDEVWFVDRENELWKKGPFLPEPRMGGIAVTYGKNMYFLGGYDPDNSSDGQNVYFLTPVATSWNTGPKMTSHLFGLSAVSFTLTQEGVTK